MSRFDFFNTPIEGLKVVDRKPIGDHRGFFSRFYCGQSFREAGIECGVSQINHSYSKSKGTIRGMHFQFPPNAEVKYVSCIKGEIFDVAIDLRRDSPTFLQWYGEILSDSNHKSLLIPKGFAHGFQTLVDGCELIYVVSDPYDPSSEGAVNPFDPKFDIQWPLPVSEISMKDKNSEFITDEFQGILV